MPECGPISIWRLSPETLESFATLPPSRLATAQAQLSIAERRRADAFHAEEDRLLYVAAHVALRVVLARSLRLPPDRLEFTGDGGGKPALLHPSPASPALRFNLAHTRGAVLIATAAGCEVGIDIERHRPIEDLEALVHTIASPAEQAAWEALATVSRQQAFYRLWTRKEAYLKAIGLGLFRNLQAVTVPVTPMDLSQAVLVNDCGESLPWPCWRLCDLPAWEGFSAALCWQSSDSASHPLPEMTIQDLSANDLSAGYLA